MESGYLINDKFITTEQANALLVANPEKGKADVILDDAKPAQRHPDGQITTGRNNP